MHQDIKGEMLLCLIQICNLNTKCCHFTLSTDSLTGTQMIFNLVGKRVAWAGFLGWVGGAQASKRGY